MVEQSKGISTQTVLAGLFGIVFGGFLLYLFLKNTNQLKSANSNVILQNQQPNFDPNINSLGLSIQQRLYDIEQQLKLSERQPKDSTYYQPSENNILPIQNHLSQDVPIAPPASYKNKEIVEYVKDIDGDIIKKITTRDASINDRRK